MEKILITVIALLIAIPAYSKKAEEFTFDGIKLGDNYQEKVLNRMPYMAPCDNDPVDKKTRRAMFYAPRECRKTPAFPDNTLVSFCLKFDDSENLYSQPIEEILWLGGKYFEGKTDFPYTIDINPEAITAFGKCKNNKQRIQEESLECIQIQWRYQCSCA